MPNIKNVDTLNVLELAKQLFSLRKDIMKNNTDLNDYEGGTFFGYDIPATGGEYPWTLSEINSDKAVGRYGNKYQIEKGDDKLKVAPIPFDQSLLPLPIRDSSIQLYYQTIK